MYTLETNVLGFQKSFTESSYPIKSCVTTFLPILSLTALKYVQNDGWQIRIITSCWTKWRKIGNYVVYDVKCFDHRLLQGKCNFDIVSIVT